MSRTIKDNRYATDKATAKERVNRQRRQRLRDQEDQQQASFYTSKEIARLTRRGRS